MIKKSLSSLDARSRMLLILLGGTIVALSSTLLYRLVRGFWSGGTGLIWDLFLAWIPFLIAWGLHYRPWSKQTTIGLLFLWWLFYPNAPYLLTQLTRSDNAWLFVAFFITFPVVSLFVGTASLFLVHQVVDKLFGRTKGWVFIVFSLFSAGVGVYIGRFLRFNSWDILTTPMKIIRQMLQAMINPATVVDVWGFILILAFLPGFTYVGIRQMGKWMQEEIRETSY